MKHLKLFNESIDYSGRTPERYKISIERIKNLIDDDILFELKDIYDVDIDYDYNNSWTGWKENILRISLELHIDSIPDICSIEDFQEVYKLVGKQKELYMLFERVLRKLKAEGYEATIKMGITTFDILVTLV